MVIRYDVRGFGKSSRPTEKYSDIEDLLTLLTNLKVNKTHVVGVSNGGRIAIDFTQNHPGMVDALVLVGSAVSGYKTTGPEEDEVWAEFEKQIEGPQELAAKQGRIAEAVKMDVDAWGSAQSPSSRERLLEIAMDNSHIHLEAPQKWQVDPVPPGFEGLTAMSVPTLVMIGDRDVRGMRFIAQQLHARIPSSRLAEVAGADHIMNMSKPNEFNRIVLEFLNNQV
jgi:pimeloyl-ACP methyl ester carboxylesterase